MDRYADSSYAPNEEIFNDTADRILALSDRLSEEIIISNIESQLEEEIDPLIERINYIELFRKKYSEITPDDPCYDEEYMKEVLEKLAITLKNGIKEKYFVGIGTDIEFSNPEDYLYDFETLYEFLFVRHYQNILDYLKSEIQKNRENFIMRYNEMISDKDNSKDIFVVQTKKKFQDKETAVMMHFIDDIISDICSETTSAYNLFQAIVNTDKFEEYNNRMNELLFNYGNKFVSYNDTKAAELYLKPLKNPSFMSELRNQLLIMILDEAALNEQTE